MLNKETYKVVPLERAATPESVGVDSKVITEYVEEIEKRGFRFDSLMIIRYGKVAAEFNWKPYELDVPHDMYSFSKTVTATAIGFAVCEGLISLDTKVYSLFPEYYNRLSNSKKKKSDKLTVHSLLSMCSGKNINMFNNTEKMDWTENYLMAGYKCDPDKKWDYVSENIFMLSRIIKQVTGQGVIEYLTPRLFEPLQMEIPFWETEHTGVESGGWGLRFTTEQMAKFTMLYLNNGVWNGKQVLPQEWVDIATKSHIPQVPCIIHDGTSYGYQTWLNKNPNYIRFDGLYGQISVAFKDFDAVVVFTARDPREYEYIKMIFDFFPRGFVDGVAEKSDSEIASFKASQIRKGYDYIPATKRNTAKENEISGRDIKLKEKSMASVLGPVPFFMWKKKIGKISNIRFDFSGEKPMFIWQERNCPENKAVIGFDGEFEISEVQFADEKMKIAVLGSWNGNGELTIVLHVLGAIQVRIMKFNFGNCKVKINSKCKMDIGELLWFYVRFLGLNLPNGLKTGLVDKIIPIANEIIFDPNLKGRFLK